MPLEPIQILIFLFENCSYNYCIRSICMFEVHVRFLCAVHWLHTYLELFFNVKLSSSDIALSCVSLSTLSPRKSRSRSSSASFSLCSRSTSLLDPALQLLWAQQFLRRSRNAFLPMYTLKNLSSVSLSTCTGMLPNLMMFNFLQGAVIYTFRDEHFASSPQPFSQHQALKQFRKV